MIRDSQPRQERQVRDRKRWLARDGRPQMFCRSEMAGVDLGSEGQGDL